MITFNKLTSNQSEILYNYEVIGLLERLADTYYRIEILYSYETAIPIERKRLVAGLIERIYKRHLAREERKRRKLKPYKQFKIVE